MKNAMQPSSIMTISALSSPSSSPTTARFSRFGLTAQRARAQKRLNMIGRDITLSSASFSQRQTLPFAVPMCVGSATRQASAEKANFRLFRHRSPFPRLFRKSHSKRLRVPKHSKMSKQAMRTSVPVPFLKKQTLFAGIRQRLMFQSARAGSTRAAAHAR